MKKLNIRFGTILLLFACVALASAAQAVTPAPDGGYPGFNTAEGINALQNLTTGVANSAVGWRSLFSNIDGSYNTALGAGTLLFNVGDQNTGEGTQNTAIGTAALLFNTTGFANTADGVQALFNNTTGQDNVAIGTDALLHNDSGNGNDAVGLQALFSNTSGGGNTAIGNGALYSNTTGGGNIAIGAAAGSNLTTGGGNICIGQLVAGVAGESNTTRIGNVYFSVATTRAVYVDSDNKIGALSSSRRYKEQIQPMEQASQTLFALKPVTFRYKKEVDPSQSLSFGLIAEEVAKVSADLITRDKEGQPETVRYEAVNAMLLNEFLKEHRRVQELQANAEEQSQEIHALTATVKEQAAQIQKVSAHIALQKVRPQNIANNSR
jgi:Chaperone of endosialidase